MSSSDIYCSERMKFHLQSKPSSHDRSHIIAVSSMSDHSSAVNHFTARESKEDTWNVNHWC